MHARCYSVMILSALVLMACSVPVFANSIAPTAYFLPGLLPLTFGLALPATVLAAFLERPFVNRAGVRQYALWVSLQANLVSLVIGYVTLPVGIDAIYKLGPAWPVVAICMSIVSEGYYYQWHGVGGAVVRWRWVIMGNVFSSFVLMLIPFAVEEIIKSRRNWVWELDRYYHGLFWGSVAGSVLVFGLSFIVPFLLRGVARIEFSKDVRGHIEPESFSKPLENSQQITRAIQRD